MKKTTRFQAAMLTLSLLSSLAATAKSPEPVGADRLTAIVTGDAARQGTASSTTQRPKAIYRPAPDAHPQWSIAEAERHAVSVGAPNAGSLTKGTPLPESGPGFVRRRSRRDSPRHFGTDETIGLLIYTGSLYTTAYPGAAPLMVGDISEADGGKIRPHRSHRTGRDVDIAFPEVGDPGRTWFNGDLTAEGIAFERTWFVFETLLLTGRVEYIFASKHLLAPIRRAAKDAGWDDAALDGWIRMDRETPGRQPIRSSPGHGAHFHIRFHCPEGDPCDAI